MSPLNPNSSTESPIEEKAVDSLEFLSTEDTEEQETLELEKDTKKPEKAPEKEDKEDGKPGEEDKEGKTLEDELEEELQEELETPDEEELELIAPVRRKEILAKYPDLFKDFPYLQKAYYYDQQITQILPTIEDAKTAVEKAETLDSFEAEIMKGSTETLLATVKENDRDAFARVVDNYLPTLFKVDQDAYFHTIGNIIKHTIISMVRDGKAADTEELITAADTLNQYIFGTKTFSHPSRLSRDEKPEDNQKEQELSERERNFVEREFNTAKDNVSVKIDNVIKATVDKNIDPKGSMTDYVKRNAVREVNEKLENLIEKDKRFRDIYDKLWERAANDNFSKESMDRIYHAYMSKAKTLLPPLIKSSRNEALRGLGIRVRDTDTDDRDKKGPLPVGKTRGSAPSRNADKSSGNESKSVPKGMTSLEYLMQD